MEFKSQKLFVVRILICIRTNSSYYKLSFSISVSLIMICHTDGPSIRAVLLYESYIFMSSSENPPNHTVTIYEQKCLPLPSFK